MNQRYMFLLLELKFDNKKKGIYNRVIVKMKKFLTIVFFILLVLLIGEIGYYFFYLKNSFTNVVSIPESNTSNDRGYLLWLKKREKVMKSSIMIDQSEGEIVSLTTNNSLGKSNMELVLEGKNGYFTFNIDLSKLKIFEQKGNENKPINISKLKPKDNVIIKEIFDTFPDQIETLETIIIKVNN